MVPLYLDTSLRYPYQNPVQVVRLVEKVWKTACMSWCYADASVRPNSRCLG